MLSSVTMAALLYLLALCCTLFVIFLTTIHFFKPRKFSSTPDLPPGNMGWPFIGETFEFVSNPEKFIHERKQKYSRDIFKTSIIGQKVIVLCGPSANKFIYSNENKLFSFWLPPSVGAILAVTNIDFTSPSMILATAEAHKLLKAETLQHMVPIMDAESRKHLDIHWSSHNELKIRPFAQMFTFSLSCRLFVNSTPEQTKQLFSYFAVMNGGGVCFKINIPGTEYYESRRREKALRVHLVEIIKQRRLDISTKEGEGEGEGAGASFDGYQDLLTRILVSCKLKGVTINDKELAARIISLLFASFFTTSNSLTFTLGYLAQYPHIYAKVLQEQLAIAKSKEVGDVLNWKDVQKMKYTWNVVCESMRHRSPAFGSFREAITDFTYAGYRVPKGWKVHWNVHTTNKDPSNFENVDTFDPSRFEDNKVPPFAFVPFGGGPKMCGGKEYTRIELLIFLYNVVTKFKLEIVNPNENIIYNPNPIPAEGLRLKLERRDSQAVEN